MAVNQNRQAIGFGVILAVVIAILWIAFGPVLSAKAHTPAITADCNGVVLHATAYDGSKANVWSVTIGGAEQPGTFGASLDRTFPVPQQGATTAWSARIAAHNGTYEQVKSGTVGPCGPVKPGDLVTETEWTHGEPACGAAEYEETREVTTVTYAYNPATNDFDAQPPVTVTQTRIHVLTPEEVAALAAAPQCQPTSTPTPTPTPTPPADQCGTPDTLSCSGPREVALLLGIGIPLALLGVLAVLFSYVRKRNHPAVAPAHRKE